MGHGAMSTWKVRCRSLFIRKILIDLETRQKRRIPTNVLLRSIRSLAKSREPCLLDVATFHDLAWQNMTNVTTLRCLLKLKILPPGREADVAPQFCTELLVRNSRGVKKPNGFIYHMNLDTYLRDPF